MRILYWTDTFWPNIGGVETFSANLVRGLRQRGHVIQVITSPRLPGLPEREVVEGVEVIRVPMESALRDNSPEAVFRCRRQVRDVKERFRPDVIHINTFGPVPVFHLLTLNASPAPAIVSLHAALEIDAAFEGEGNAVLAKLVHSAYRATGCSESVSNDLRRFYPDSAHKIETVRLGLPIPEYQVPVYPEDPVFLCVGRAVPNKGFDTAVQAFQRIIQARHDARLIVAGDGTELDALKNLAASLGIAGAVDFRGWVEPARIPALLQESTAVVVPSRGLEGMPIVAIEAAIESRPVIATRVNGLPELVEHGVNGYLFEPDDVETLAGLMGALVEAPGLVSRLGKAARDRVEAGYALDTMVDRFESLFQQAISSVAVPKCEEG